MFLMGKFGGKVWREEFAGSGGKRREEVPPCLKNLWENCFWKFKYKFKYFLKLKYKYKFKYKIQIQNIKGEISATVFEEPVRKLLLCIRKTFETKYNVHDSGLMEFTIERACGWCWWYYLMAPCCSAMPYGHMPPSLALQSFGFS